MLKDIFKKKKDKDIDIKERIMTSLMDGYVDVKAFKHDDKGNKTLVYHDTGDNTVTNWMRQTIMQLLSGYSFSNNGNGTANDGNADEDQYSKVSEETGAHTSSYNKDGYCLNGEQYLWTSSTFVGHPISANTSLYSEKLTHYPIFPTKVLLGTGCEYTDWDSLKEANEEDNSTWYTNMVTQYGDGDSDTAESNFNNLVGINDSAEDISDYNCNVYSGTIGSQGAYTGSGSMLRAVTVNDPDTTSNVSSSADMANRYGVVGAIKTLYCPTSDEDCSDYLESTVSESGRLIKGYYRGAGRPCFIYFNRTAQDSDELDWDKQTSDIYVSKDASNSYLNRITFRITIPAQSSGTGAIGVYNPFNGYTIKQMGLFNDAIFSTDSKYGSSASGSSYIINNMPCGMMLAVKNVQSFSKTQDSSIVVTWTLTL